MSKAVFNELTTLINQKKELEEQLETLKTQLKKSAANITPEFFEDYTYDEIKPIWDSIKYDVNSSADFTNIIERKKSEKYPEMQKAVYYPEINELTMPDEEKIRLDRAARKNYRNHINKYNMDRLPGSLSEQDLELLKNIGIVKKKYTFMCPECGCSVTSFSEEELQKFLRVWELESIDNKSEEEDIELDALYKAGYMDFVISCLECDEVVDIEISSKEDLEKYAEHYMPVYIVNKQPDLKYEKL